MVELEKVFNEINAGSRGITGPVCPRCNATSGRGFFYLEKPVIIKMWFIKVNAILKIIYCPNCGLLQLRVGNIQVEGKQEY